MSAKKHCINPLRDLMLSMASYHPGVKQKQAGGRGKQEDGSGQARGRFLCLLEEQAQEPSPCLALTLAVTPILVYYCGKVIKLGKTSILNIRYDP